MNYLKNLFVNIFDKIIYVNFFLFLINLIINCNLIKLLYPQQCNIAFYCIIINNNKLNYFNFSNKFLNSIQFNY